MGATQEQDSAMQHPNPSSFKLVGHKNFVRSNPRSDRFPVLGFHHIEFWTSDASAAAGRFSFGLGMPLTARSDLSTGNPVHASYLVQSGSLKFLFTAPYGAGAVGFAGGGVAAIPSFDADVCRKFFVDHGLAVRAIAIQVENATEAFEVSVANGAIPSFAPRQLSEGFTMAEISLYGDVVLRFISLPKDNTQNSPSFLPGFEDVSPAFSDFGLKRLDHAVGNVPNLAETVAYIAKFTGFHEFAEFVAEDVGTAESGLNSVVLANNEETVLIPLNEPVHGTKRRSQIQTYLDYNCGPGVQHLALSTNDVLKTLRQMQARTALGGFEFMPPPPPNYYDGVRRRAGDVLSEEQIKECQELGVLVDRDDQGVLLQIFTKPVGDRPTIFVEIIQRVGCMLKDEEGREYQKGGCGGFGKGNFSELFKSIEEYEKSLEAKQATAVAAV
ncbi:4-hydroxyphenylpyruvate dioxygenase [Rhynchospora pubera]|uniref:4-hydroxyphenylpyruvate dioxygenase n=1 Tax=Rhynchospora pubera TaxID=906938 RepID=A0AAV8HUT4_9POAL|nr:4-hydroxyphenylpyruvate dioxygenase [Rhynchospora pubera]